MAAEHSSASPQMLFPLEDLSQIADARRQVTRLMQAMNFGERTRADAALALTEAATNVLKHARRGHLVVRLIDCGEARGIEILALDSGPGIADIQLSLRNGYSTAGSLGAGMSTFSRLADSWDLYTLPGKGSALRLEFWSAAAPGDAIQTGVICLPRPGELVCGDAWAIRQIEGRYLVMVVDGLGHGPDAAQAASMAISVPATGHELAPASMLESIHRAIVGTRGAAVAVALLEPEREHATFAGVGNIAAMICLPDRGKRHLVSRNGIVGHNIGTIREMTSEFPAEALLLLHSDGLGSHWNLAAYPGLGEARPAIVAGVLWRDHVRGRDDVTVLAVRNAPTGAIHS